MSPKIEKMVKKALELPSQDRAFIAEKLLESLDYEEPFEVSKDWKKEINERCRQIDKGDAQLLPGDKVFKEAIERLKK